MTANTPLFGFPYPEGTDRVADGDNAMQALALALETQMSGQTANPSGPYRLQAGVTAMGTLGTNAGLTVAITFAAGRFTQPPIAAVTGVAGNAFVFGGAGGPPTISGMALRIYNPTATPPSSASCHWLAVQMSPAAAPGLADAPAALVETDNATATCHTDGCGNTGIVIPLFIDPGTDGVVCGVCSLPITDWVPL